MKPRSALQQYANTEASTSAQDLDSHRVVQMLMQGALDKISTAQGYLKQGNLAKKGECISVAISIVEALLSCLDKEQGGGIAENLEVLYNYMLKQLLQGTIDNDPKLFEEVHQLLTEVKAGWDEVRNDALEFMKEQKKS